MCKVINAKVVLANLLTAHNKPVTIKHLKEIRQQLESKISGLYVDVTSDSVFTAVEMQRNMFKWDNDDIIRADNSDERFTAEAINKRYNWRIPEDIRPAVVEVLST